MHTHRIREKNTRILFHQIEYFIFNLNSTFTIVFFNYFYFFLHFHLNRFFDHKFYLQSTKHGFVGEI